MASLLALASLLLAPALTAAAECGCYKTDNGGTYSDVTYFDFRHRDVAAANEPNGEYADSYGETSSKYLKSSEFAGFWDLQEWKSDGSTDESGTTLKNTKRDPANVYIDSNTDSTTGASSKLVLRNYGFDTFASGGELQWNQDYFQYGSFRFRGKVSGSNSGSCAGFFTYYSPDDAVTRYETDIEFLSGDASNIVHYSEQPLDGGDITMTSWDMNSWTKLDSWSKPTGGASTRRTRRSYSPLLSNKKRQSGDGFRGWKTHRFDWQSDKTSFYVDGKKATDLTDTANIPQQPIGFNVNMWSNGDPGWSGDLAVGEKAYFEIEWIEMFYNDAGDDCSNPCNVDEADGAIDNGFSAASSS